VRREVRYGAAVARKYRATICGARQAER